MEELVNDSDEVSTAIVELTKDEGRLLLTLVDVAVRAQGLAVAQGASQLATKIDRALQDRFGPAK